MPREILTYLARPLRSETLPGLAWWVAFPPFALLVGRLTFERACADPQGLLLPLMASPRTAWPIALLYVVAHVWLLIVYVRLVERTNALWPGFAVRRAIEGSEMVKILLMTVVFALEYFPVSVWRAIGGFACPH